MIHCAAAFLYAMSSSVLLAIALGFACGGLNAPAALVSLGGGACVGLFSLLRRRSCAPSRGPRGWEWCAVALFAWFTTRAFLWLVTVEGDEIKTVVWNNVGDLSLHLGFIRYVANGAPFWPDSPIFSGGKLTYALGSDLFNSLLVLAGVDVYRGLVLVGIICCAITGVALWRWGRAFTVAGFLCNGGFVALVLFLPHSVAEAVTGSPVGFPTAEGWPAALDLQGSIAWKSIPISMFITQRGFLFALPAGLLLLCSWRARFFGGQGADEWRMPWWGEFLLYISMPIFHVHSFIALSLMLGAFFLARPDLRKPLLRFVGLAIAPASVLVWLAMGMLQSTPPPLVYDMSEVENPPPRPASKVMGWKPGWMTDDEVTQRGFSELGGDPAVPTAGAWIARFAYFWLLNFGVLPFIIVALVVMMLRMVLRRNIRIGPAFLWCGAALLLCSFLDGWEHYRSGELFGDPRAVDGISMTPLLAAVLAAIAGAMQPKDRKFRMIRGWLFAVAALFAIGASLPPAFAALRSVPVNALPLLAVTVATVWLLLRVGSDWHAPLWPAVFVLPALYIFFLCCFVKFAPWEWDNTKVMIWPYLIVLPFVWDFVISRFRFWSRMIVCELLFFSGFVTLVGALLPDMPYRTVASRSELEMVERAVRDIPITEPIIAHPTHDHPLILVGRRVALGYPGHIASHGMNPTRHQNHITAIMRGALDWRILAAELGAHHLFWGRREQSEYGAGKKDWRESQLVGSGPDFEVFDITIPSLPVEAAGN